MLSYIDQRGMPYFRALLSRAATVGKSTGIEYASVNFGSRTAELVRSAVAAGGISSGDWGAILSTPEAQEFWSAVEKGSVVGRLGLRQVSLNVRTLFMADGAQGYWVGAKNPKPLTAFSLDGDTLTPLKVAAIYVLTKEAARHSNPRAQAALRDDLIRVLGEVIDSAFLDASNAGIADEQPASVLNGVSPIPSTGYPEGDIAQLIEAFGGNLMTASLVTDPISAARMGLSRDAGGAVSFPDCSPRGGSALGLPLLVSRSSPRDTDGGQLALIDGGAVAFAADGVRSAASDQATLEMSDSPSGPAQHTSLFQTNCVALLNEVIVNWRLINPDGVAVISGIDYQNVQS